MTRGFVWALPLLLWLAGVSTAQEPAARPELAWLPLGGETFQLEIALDPRSRYIGLSGRAEIPRNGGMLFVLPTARPLSMVMRDCPAAIDVAFLDVEGRVVALHEMPPEPARMPGESRRDYERRLPTYGSEVPVQFAIETAGGRLRELGVSVGDRVPLDVALLAARAR